EERRLLYVGITRARRHLAISWAGRRIGSTGREGSRRPSRFLAELGFGAGGNPPGPSSRPRSGAPRERLIPGTGSEGGFEALRTWRAERARADGVPAYVIAHDATLVALVEAHPVSIPDLGRVKGMGPARVERYGAEILAALEKS
ncbi:MAG TPA: HRDC domain-containing protein, partial [Candidatus Limnocylindrales bacterium]